MLPVAWVDAQQRAGRSGAARCPADGQPACQRPRTKHQQGERGKARPRRNASTSTAFWPGWLFVQQEGCPPGQAGPSAGCWALMAEGRVVCSVSFLSHFLEGGRDLPELGR